MSNVVPTEQNQGQDAGLPVRHFAYDVHSESFIITNPVDNTEIIIPSLKRLFEKFGGGGIHPGKFFAVLEDGAKLCAEKAKVYSNRYGSHYYTVNNRESGWMVLGYKGEGGNIMMSEDKSLRGHSALHLVNPDMYSFTLFDLKGKAQFNFSATILDHSGLVRKEMIEKPAVKGEKLRGLLNMHSWVDAMTLPETEEKFLADFDAKYARCHEFSTKSFFSQPMTIYQSSGLGAWKQGDPTIDGEVVLSRGDVAKGEPLLTLKKFWAPPVTDEYGTRSRVTTDTLFQEPSERYEFYGIAPGDQPVMQKDHIALYRTMGGIAITDERKREHYYIIGNGEGEGQAYIRTVDNLAKLDLRHIYGAFEICSLGGRGKFDLSAEGAQNPMYHAVKPLRVSMTHFDLIENQQYLFYMALQGQMPQAVRLSRPEDIKQQEVAAPAIDISALTAIMPQPY